MTAEQTPTVAVVTGAARGFGREIARRLAARGHAVLVTDIDEEGARGTAVEIARGAWALPQDVRDPASHREVAAAAAERGRVAVWVNNAGVVEAAPAWEHGDDELRRMVEVNLLGVMHGSRAAVAAMRGRGGHVLNLCSMSALGPVPGLAAYAATKAGVLGFSTSLQGDLDTAGIPIRVHALCPDAADTTMVRDITGRPEAAILYSSPRLLQASDVAGHAIALLDSRRIVRAVPRHRAALMRAFAPFPRAALPVLRLTARAGELRRKRVARHI